MSAPAPIRLALVGLGGHGRRIQDAAASVDAVQVVAVYDPAQAEAEAAASRFGCSSAESYDALLGRDDLDAVVLATPNHFHRAQAEAAMTAGLDVLVEKPIAGTVRDGLSMVRRAEETGRILMVGHNIRYGRAAREAKRRLDAGELGEVVSVEIHYSADNIQKGGYGGWRFEPGLVSLLPMMQLGLHAIDLVRYLAGPIDRVFAQARSVLAPPGVVDNVTASFSLEGGVAGTAVSNYCTPDWFEVRVSGTKAVMSVNWIPHALTVLPRGRRTDPPEHHDYSDYDLEDQVRQLEAFAGSVRTRTAPETDGNVGLHALAVVESMARSAETGQPVTVSNVLSGRP